MSKLGNEEHRKNKKNIGRIKEDVRSNLKKHHGIPNKSKSVYSLKLDCGPIIRCAHLPFRDIPYRKYAPPVKKGETFDILSVFDEWAPNEFHFVGWCRFGDMEEDETDENFAGRPIRKILLDDLNESWDELIKYLKNRERWSIFMQGFE